MRSKVGNKKNPCNCELSQLFHFKREKMPHSITWSWVLGPGIVILATIADSLNIVVACYPPKVLPHSINFAPDIAPVQYVKMFHYMSKMPKRHDLKNNWSFCSI
jgi:hypothetical protein